MVDLTGGHVLNKIVCTSVSVTAHTVTPDAQSTVDEAGHHDGSDTIPPNTSPSPPSAANIHAAYEEQTINILRHSTFAPFTVTNKCSVFSSIRLVPVQADPEDASASG